MEGAVILSRWQRAEPSRLGRALFSRALGLAVPYTGTIRPEVLELRPGHALIAMKDRRQVRNHLRSVHAIALVNLGELASGLALLTGLPPDARGIVKGLSIEYLKKARGRLVAKCSCKPPTDSAERNFTVVATICDAAGDDVAIVSVDWRIGPRPA